MQAGVVPAVSASGGFSEDVEVEGVGLSAIGMVTGHPSVELAVTDVGANP